MTIDKTDAIDALGGIIVAQDDAVVYGGIRDVLESARARAASSVNREMVMAYWEVGRRIHEAVGDRADYGQHLISFLSERLTRELGKGFTTANLKNMRQFYRTFEKSYAVRSELSWTHFRTLMRIGAAARIRPGAGAHRPHAGLLAGACSPLVT